MLKCGLQYEGLLRNADKNNQGICDAAMYGYWQMIITFQNHIVPFLKSRML